MKLKRKSSLIAMSVAVALAARANAGTTDYVDVQIVGSTTFSLTAQGYTSTVTAAPQATVYYAVELQMGAIGNKNGTNNAITTLPFGTAGDTSLSYNLTDSAITFNTDNQVQAPFSDGAPSNGTIGATPASGSVAAGTGIANVVGSINVNGGDKPQGVGSTTNQPALSLVQLGSVKIGSTSSTILGSYGTTSGSFKINNGSALSHNVFSVNSGDPNGYFEFDPLTLTVGPSGPTAALTAKTAGTPQGYGSSQGTLSVPGSHAAGYSVGHVQLSSPGNQGYIEETGIAAGDMELYALKFSGNTSGKTDAQIAAAISGTGVSAQAVGSSPFADLFAGYDVLLTSTATTSSDQYFGFNFSGDYSGVTVSDIEAVPEPASRVY